MKKYLLFLFLLLISLSQVFATHNRAGEITYKHLYGNTYKITLLTYTYSPSPADRPELEVFWGDGTSDTLPRVQKFLAGTSYTASAPGWDNSDMITILKDGNPIGVELYFDNNKSIEEHRNTLINLKVEDLELKDMSKIAGRPKVKYSRDNKKLTYPEWKKKNPKGTMVDYTQFYLNK